MTKKVFCFGHTFDGAQDLNSCFSSKTDLVVFPPEGDLDTGMSMVGGGDDHYQFNLGSTALLHVALLSLIGERTLASFQGGMDTHSVPGSKRLCRWSCIWAWC